MPDAEYFYAEPSEAMQQKIESIQTGTFQKIAERFLSTQTTCLSIIHGVVGGGTTYAAFVVTNMPHAAVYGATAFAAYVSYKFFKLNDHYKDEYLSSRIPWDRMEHRAGSALPFKGGSDTVRRTLEWKLSYGAWKFLLAYAPCFGYLMGLQWVLAGLGGPDNFFSDPIMGFYETSKMAFLLTVADWGWDVLDADSRMQLFRKNEEQHRDNIKSGVEGAIRILRRSRYLAFSVATICALAESLFSIGDITMSRNIMVAMGLTAGVAYTWRFSRLKKLAHPFASCHLAMSSLARR